MIQLCLVEDDPIMGESLAERFALEGLQASWYKNAESAEQAIIEHNFSMVVCDIRLPEKSGDQLFERLRQRSAVLPPFIFITGHGDLDRAVELLKLGAADYITKPFDIDHLLKRVNDLVYDSSATNSDEHVLGISPAMVRLENVLKRIAPLDSTVLITGPTGSGKEMVARRLHELSGRKTFLAVNCASLVENLAESELFGHERGAFTGAANKHTGVFERASGGTLLLDEIGDMPLTLQAKLLRVLQDRVVSRVGGSETINVDTRVVVATNQDLESKISAGSFREDLFYRINVVHLVLPPLAERQEDILWLAQRFLTECSLHQNRQPMRFDTEVEQFLLEHEWPGNVRELRHTLERACIFADDDCLHVEDMRTDFCSPMEPRTNEPSLNDYLTGCERRYIENSLDANDQRIGVTAENLGISRKSLWVKMKRLCIRQGSL